MAKSVLELTVETGKWDDGIKKAKRALDNFTEASGGVQEALARDTEKMQKFVQMMGGMESRAKTAKGQMNDYKGVIEQLTMQYNRMTEAQKKTIGQDYLKTIEQLRQRYQDVSREAEEMNRSLHATSDAGQETGSMLDTLTQRFTFNIDALKLFEVGMKAVGAVLDVVKDAFFANEQSIDDWGRTLESSKALYEGFLTSLNTGDVSGFLSNIDSIVKAATDAYNALDRLGTMQTIQAPALTSKQTEINRFQMMLRTGRYVAPVDGRAPTPGLKDGQVLTDAQRQAIANQLKSAMSEVSGIYKQQVQASTDAIDALYKEQADVLGMSIEQFRKGVSSMAVFEENVRRAGEYQKWEAEHTVNTIDTQTGGTNAISTSPFNPYEKYKGWSVFKDDGAFMQRIVQEIQKRAGLEQAYYGMIGRSYRGINRAEGVSPHGTREHSSRPTLATGGINVRGGAMEGFGIQSYASMAELRELLRAQQQALSNATNIFDEMQARSRIGDITWQMSDEGRQAAKLGMEREDVKMLAEEMAKALGNIKGVNIQRSDSGVKGGMEFGDFKNGFTTIVSSVGSLMSSVESLGIEVPSELKSVVAGLQVITTILTVIESLQKVGTFLGFIPHHTGGVVRAASGYRVPGNYGYDAVPAILTSGETVLTRAQAGNIASQLAERENTMPVMQPYTDGEKIYLGMNNTLKRMGRGEIVTTEMLRRLHIM